MMYLDSYPDKIEVGDILVIYADNAYKYENKSIILYILQVNNYYDERKINNIEEMLYYQEYICTSIDVSSQIKEKRFIDSRFFHIEQLKAHYKRKHYVNPL